MKTFINVAALLAFTNALQLTAEQNEEARFNAWAIQYNRSYDNVKEHSRRFKEWRKKDVGINAINANPANTFTVGHNKFSDWTDREFQNILND